MEPARHQELNRPSSVEVLLRDDFYHKKHRIRNGRVSYTNRD